MTNNLLIKGDNLTVLNYLLNEREMGGKVDLVYIDPPFAPNGLFTVSNGRAATISNSNKGSLAYSDKILGYDFIEFMRKRMFLLRELLSDRGSIYVHTDYKIGPYIRVMMDEIFGIDNFRNDITRIKCNPKNFKRLGYGNIKDSILFYTKSGNAIWNEPYQSYTDQDIKRLFPKKDGNGRRYTTVPIHAPGEVQNPKKFNGMLPPKGRHWRTDVSVLEDWDRQGLIEWSDNGNPRKIVYADKKEGKRMQDVWTDFKDPQYPIYPTEKNLDMVDLIIKTSSDKDSIVMDCFCGSGTTLEAAQRNGRHWIGVDESSLAIDITRKRLHIDEKSLFGNEAELIDMLDTTEKMEELHQI